ncbi:hypothetical protein Q5752_005997 [Cryptotrichosporon argae]
MPLRPDFLWGFATAAAQIEGGGPEAERDSGRGPSIWDAFCDTPGKIEDGAHVVRTCDHLARWKEDLALMASLGVRAYRFSISWPRVIPLGGRRDAVNERGLAFYDALIDECLALGITPFVTLYHWDLPQALYKSYGGWTSHEIIPDFVNYARLCFCRYGDRVKHWLTLNEPWCVAVLGHGVGAFAPGHVSSTEPWVVGHNLILSHAHAARLYQAEFQPRQAGTIGITLNGDWAEPYDDSPENIRAAQDKMDAAVGWFADPIYLGKYPDSLRARLGDRLPEFTADEAALVKGSSEFYGCNTYTTNTIRAGSNDEFNGNAELLFERPDGIQIGPESQLKWLRDVPWGTRKLLNYLYKRYKTPIYMTENGYAVKGEHAKDKQDMCGVLIADDTERIHYLQGYLEALRAAIETDGVDVRSYFGFCDNFEWASGMVPRFGLVHVDYETFERTPKDSARFFSEWFKSHVPATTT